MRVIWKFLLDTGCATPLVVDLVDPVLRHLGRHGGSGTEAFAWIEHTLDPPGQPKQAVTTLTLVIVGTGQPIYGDEGDYAGTFYDGPFVWHVFAALTYGR